ncbi:hypothetical protein B0H13DRAFT_1850166 [Mycena leptocephala]|nr:hypothetical protein B0H13DRAFT_1850166 [Mycena leptocephala]
MNNEKALMLTTKQCLAVFFNRLYGNNTPGALLDCIQLPRRFPCSNCLPRFVGPLYFPFPSNQPRLIPFTLPASSASPPPRRPPKQQKLTRKMRTVAEAQLRQFKERVYSLERDNIGHGFTPASAYFSNPTITSVLDHFFQITSLEILSATIPKWKYHLHHGASLLELINELQHEFAQELEAARLERNEKNRLRARSKRAATAMEEDEEDMGDEDGGEDEELVDAAEAPPPPPSVSTSQAIPAREKRVLEDTTNVLAREKRPRLAQETIGQHISLVIVVT